MELILVKNKNNAQVYQGRLQVEGGDYWFFATVQNQVVLDMVTYEVNEEDNTFKPVNDELRDTMLKVLVNDHIL